MLRFFNSKYLTSNLSSQQYYKQFIKQTVTELKIVNKSKQLNVVVPYLSSNKQLLTEMFQSNSWQNKQLIFHVDTAGLIGLKRLFFLQYLQNSVYHGIQQPNPSIAQTNPQKENSLEELQFNTQIFLLMDPDVSITKKIDENQQYLVEAQQKIDQLYSSDPNRTSNRLINELNVNAKYTSIIQTALNFQCDIFFSGINQYVLRRILDAYLSLQNLKTLLYDSLHYSYSKSTNCGDFSQYCRQFIYLNYFQIIQPYDTFKLRNLIKHLPDAIIFAHSYTFKCLSNPSSIKLQIPSSKGIDSQKIQKNALLEIMLGSLWDKKYTKNKFPYLSQDYFKLSLDDQNQLIKLYKKYLAKYTAATNKFYSSQKYNNSN